ncbi:methyltransferase [Frankia sp. R82]|uniref:methyltransferase n=1 Tax=Frankia sp. R82 TaxID=2950553 RepID=UPI002044337A|nr:methyltransferase [Frankia sp. R82]MCM3886965.1 methyltransferase [Frankia sp. R82]
MTFYDPVESSFYASCVEKVLSSAPLRAHTAAGVVELGAGSGVPVIEAAERVGPTVRVRGFEHDLESYYLARRLVDGAETATYTVEFGDFFTYAAIAKERCVIANPPYLPSRSARPGEPDLYGGPSGAEVTDRILAGPFDLAMLMVASIADPLAVLAQATRHGYQIVDWTVRPIRFGAYCREPAVWRRLQALAADGQAFFHPQEYMLAGITWLRAPLADDLPQADPAVLAGVLTSGAREVAA